MSDAAVEGVAGAVGAVSALVAFYPLLTVSTQRSVSSTNDAERPVGGWRMLPGPLKDLAQAAQKHGLAGLYAGLGPGVVGTAVSQAIYFYVYSTLRQAAVAHQRMRQGRSTQPYNTHAEGVGPLTSIAIASVAGWVNVLTTNPIWVVVTQLQAAAKGRSQGEGAWEVARRVWREQGLRGFWQGVGPSLVMVANPTITYFLYEFLVARALALRRARPARGKPAAAAAPLAVWEVFVLSALSKLGATLATYPVLVVKNRLQAMNEATEEGLRYRGVLDALERILGTEGVAGLYKGMQTKMVQTVLNQALLMSLKEEVYLATKFALSPRAGVGAGEAVPPQRGGRPS